LGSKTLSGTSKVRRRRGYPLMRDMRGRGEERILRRTSDKIEQWNRGMGGEFAKAGEYGNGRPSNPVLTGGKKIDFASFQTTNAGKGKNLTGRT